MFRIDFRGCLTGALGLVALCGFSVGARADLPDADVGLLGEAQIIYGDVQDDNQQAVQPDPSQWYFTIPLSAPSIASAEPTGTFLATPAPSLSVTTSVTALGDPSNNGYAYASGTGYLNYYFQIDGPDGTVPVQINAVGGFSLPTNAGGNFEGNATFYVTSTVDNGFVLFDVVDGRQNVPPPFIEDGIYSLETNTLYAVSLSGYATTFLGGSDFTNNPLTTLVVAYIDPTFDLLTDDPAYSIEFSPGIGNSLAAAPELSTWAMGLAGFGALARVTSGEGGAPQLPDVSARRAGPSRGNRKRPDD